MKELKINIVEQLDERLINFGIRLQKKKNEINSLKNSNQRHTQELIHNLKNPIGVVLSFSEMILADAENMDISELKRQINIIKKSAEFSLQFLNKTAQYVRLQSSEVVFLFKSQNYIDLLKQVIKKINPLAQEKEITIDSEFKKTGNLLLIDDEEMINALTYILTNSIRYSNRNTNIKVTVAKISSCIETVITDQGIGISQDDLSKIFEAYYVVNTYSENGEKCIGLELSMAQKIIKKHKGSISISSKLGHGSTVRIRLPI